MNTSPRGSNVVSADILLAFRLCGGGGGYLYCDRFLGWGANIHVNSAGSLKTIRNVLSIVSRTQDDPTRLQAALHPYVSKPFSGPHPYSSSESQY